jgi:hypothetical protein
MEARMTDILDHHEVDHFAPLSTEDARADEGPFNIPSEDAVAINIPVAEIPGRSRHNIEGIASKSRPSR